MISGDAAPQWRLLTYCAIVLALAVCASALTVWFTEAGIGLSTDSAVYLATADNIVAGKGVTTPFAGDTTRYSPAEQLSLGPDIPSVEYPPLYALALSLPRAGGLSNSTAARLINSLSLAILVVLIGIALWWLIEPPLVVLGAVAALVIVGPTLLTLIGWLNPLGLASVALSEALFLPLCLGALLAGARAATGNTGAVVTAAGLAALAVLTRYVGISAGIAAAAAVLLVGPINTRNRWRRAAVIAGAGPISVIVWNVVSRVLWGGGAARTLVWHPAATRLHLAVTVVGAWFHLPASWPVAVHLAAACVLVLAPAAMVLIAPVRRWLCPADRSEIARALLVALGGFVLAYVVAVEMTEILIDAGSQPNQRLLAPLQVATYLLLVSVATLATNRLIAGVGGRRIATTLVAVLATAGAVQPLSRLAASASALQHVARTVRAEAVGDPLRALPGGVLVFTDDPAGLWLRASVSSYRLPATVAETTGRPDNSYATEVRQVVDIVEQHRGLIIAPPAAATEYEQGSRLRSVGRCATGEVVLAVAGTAAAVAAAKTCPTPVAGAVTSPPPRPPAPG